MISDYESSEISENESKKFFENEYNSKIRTISNRIIAILKDYSPLFIKNYCLR